MARGLETEIETYRRKLPKLLETPGKYVLIKGKRVLGVFGTRDAALKAAYAKLGTRVAFLVKEIQAVEKPIRVPLPAWAFQNAAFENTTRPKRRRFIYDGRAGMFSLEF